MNFKRFFILTDRLSQLVDDQTQLFLSEFGYVDWLTLEQFRAKYPDFKKAQKELDVYVFQTIDELRLLYPNSDTLYHQALSIFNSNE